MDDIDVAIAFAKLELVEIELDLRSARLSDCPGLKKVHEFLVKGEQEKENLTADVAAPANRSQANAKAR